MLDSDLAKLFGCKNGTKEINQTVSRNKEKFSIDVSWTLSGDEVKCFLVTKCDQKIETRGGRYKNPRVFTEEGIIILSTILKGSNINKISEKIIKAFEKIDNNILMTRSPESTRNIRDLIYEESKRDIR